MLGALTAEGVVAAMSSEAASSEAATGTAVFPAFLDRVPSAALVRTKPGAVAVMDNPSAHKVAAARARLERAGLRLLQLLHMPRRAPEPSPIEPCRSKVEERPRDKAARPAAALNEALGPARDAIGARNARGFFRGCGYPVPPN